MRKPIPATSATAVRMARMVARTGESTCVTPEPKRNRDTDQAGLEEAPQDLSPGPEESIPVWLEPTRRLWSGHELVQERVDDPRRVLRSTVFAGDHHDAAPRFEAAPWSDLDQVDPERALDGPRLVTLDPYPRRARRLRVELEIEHVGGHVDEGLPSITKPLQELWHLAAQLVGRAHLANAGDGVVPTLPHQRL
jgi:hypothetical protein